MRLIPAAALLLAAINAAAEPLPWSDPAALAAHAASIDPALRRVDAGIAALRERRLIETSQPNPMGMAAVENLPIDLGRDEMTMVAIGASQTLVRRDRRERLGQRVDLEIEALELERRSLLAETQRDVLTLYARMAALDEKLETMRRTEAVLQTMSEVARARYEAGGGSQAEIIRAQLQRSDLQHRLLGLQGERRSLAAELLVILGLPASESVPTLHAEHDIVRTIVPALPGDHPAIAREETFVRQQDLEIELARLAFRPDWSLEATYGIRPDHTDMVSFGARVEIPLRREKLLEPRVREAAARREAAQAAADQTRRSLQREMALLRTTIEELEIQLRFHDEVLVPQARLAMSSALSAYQAGKGDLTAAVDAEVAFLRYHSEYFDFLARLLVARADLDALLAGARNRSRDMASPSAAATTSTTSPSASRNTPMGGM